MNLFKDEDKNFFICVICIVAGVALTIYVFAASRTDPGLRMAALVQATNIATALIAVASTLLTGKNLTNSGKAPPALPDLPASVATASTTETTTTTTAAKEQ